MSYFDDFKTLSTMYGSDTAKQRISAMQQTFDEYFYQSPNKITLTIDGTKELAIIQNIKYGEQFNDEKLLIVLNSAVVGIGSLVLWDDKTWLVMNQENRAIQTRKVFKIVLCNNSVSWKDSVGNIFVEKCFVEEGLGIQDDNNRVPLSVSRRIVSLQANVNTKTIYENQRFIFNKKRVFKVVDVDDFTRQDGLIILKMEKDEVLVGKDDLPNNIAYNGEVNPIPTPTTGVEFTKESLEIPLSFEDTVGVYEYINKVPTATTFTFRVDGIPSDAYTIVSTTGNSITIRCEKYFYTGTLVAISPTLVEYSIPLVLNSLF